ncbi:MAG: DUF3795 domain-containing protein [Clostridia bacterium]|nr:DUF3795 domain-containing protein [Clostridia bacterium]MBQ3869760.1 DUF3795 domain-containing protein [Clostridia bacterium]
MKKADIIILAGQSNAVGCSEVRYLSGCFPEEKLRKWRDGFDNIKINYFSHDKKSGGFVKTSFNCSVKNEDTFGPEVGIADLLDETYPGREFFIVKCAFGGVTLLRDFLPPSGGDAYDPEAFAELTDKADDPYGSSKPGWCYNELVKITEQSVAMLKEDGYLPKIRAFCWMQGESDANNEEATQKYGRNYDALKNDLKTRFAGLIDHCRFIDAGVSRVWERYARMNGIKQSYASARPDCVFIDTVAEGLDTMKEPYGEPDIGHYDAGSEIKLGRLFAEKMKGLFIKNNVAYCGLDCENCDAYIAAQNDDNELRIKTAKLWSELNGADITPDMINCDGCRANGRKTVFCESICRIRRCAKEKKIGTCGECENAKTCEKLALITKNDPEAFQNLL